MYPQQNSLTIKVTNDNATQLAATIGSTVDAAIEAGGDYLTVGGSKGRGTARRLQQAHRALPASLPACLSSLSGALLRAGRLPSLHPAAAASILTPTPDLQHPLPLQCTPGAGVQHGYCAVRGLDACQRLPATAAVPTNLLPTRLHPAQVSNMATELSTELRRRATNQAREKAVEDAIAIADILAEVGAFGAAALAAVWGRQRWRGSAGEAGAGSR